MAIGKPVPPMARWLCASPALRDVYIERMPLDYRAALYGMQQIQAAGGLPYDAYPIACWYARASKMGPHGASDELTISLWVTAAEDAQPWP